MEKEKQLLILCRQLIEQSLNWGDSSIWSNDDFEQLSEKIFEQTKVQLSVSTLKRIWGKVKYENFPTAGTLNALASFLGYENWRDFRQKNQVAEENAPIVMNNESPEIPVELKPSPENGTKAEAPYQVPYLQIAATFIFMICLLLIIHHLYLIKVEREKPVDPSKIKFEAIKTSDKLPNSVIFNYDATIFKSDNVMIQQSWDQNRQEQVDPNGKQHTAIYYEPGFFIAKLLVDNKVKKQCPVFIKTNGWMGVIGKLPIPTYLSEKEIKGNGYLGVSDSLLRLKTGTPVFNNTWIKFANVREFKDIDAHNFVLETTLRNASSVEASVCRSANVVVLGTGNAMIIPLSDKGCVSDLGVLTGDIWIDGKNHDLSAFGCDFSQFQTLKCVVQKQTLKIYLNNKLILTTGQKHSMGEIVGLRYEFAGAGQVKDIGLSTPGKGTYYEEFK